MDLKELMWEGPDPIVPPNLGHEVRFAWCPEDWRQFELSVRAAYPNVFFYEKFLRSERSGEIEPKLMRIERLDQSRPGRVIQMLFPDPAWEPKLIRGPNQYGKPEWDLDQYWSPRIWMGPPTAGPRDNFVRWEGAEDANLPAWPGRSIQSSYRRQFENEVTCQSKILNLARKRGRRMVIVFWKSFADYQAGIGKVPERIFPKNYFVSEGVLDWYRQSPKHMLGVNSMAGRDWTFAYLPPEDVPDHFWGDVKKPKWVLEAIEKYRR